MSRRCLIAIGCDRYDAEHDLEGAEVDARRVFSALMTPEIGDYDASGSRLLLSPTLADIRAAVREVLIQPGEIETLTIYFAGHGGVKAGTFYLLPRDASSSLLSATALSASELLSMIAEAAPLQTNLVVDACQAGGLSGDIRALLRPEDLGATETPGVTVIAMAARNQAALEEQDGGIGTSAFLDCINGRTFVSDNRPSLDLLEIGTRVAEMLAADDQQRPVVWGLNLFGPRRFCRNPSFGGGGGPLRATLGNWNDPATREAIEGAMPRLWKIWEDLSAAEWSPRGLIDEIQAVLGRLPSDHGRAQLLERISAAADLRSKAAPDRLRLVEVRAAVLASGLPHARDPAVAGAMHALSLELAELTEEVVSEAASLLEANRFALLSSQGGISDLFILPLRITRLAGWAAAAHHIRASSDAFAATSSGILRRLLAAVIAQLPSSILAISDSQAAPLACVVSAAQEAGAREEAEALIGAMFLSVVRFGDCIAAAHIEPDQILQFLVARGTGQFEPVQDSLARPSELITVLLRAAAMFDLDDEFDPHMVQLDGMEGNAFLPVTYSDFAANMIREGVNAGYSIGGDIFTVEELTSAWRPAPEPKGEERVGAILASLLLPDRTCWFLLPRKIGD